MTTLLSVNYRRRDPLYFSKQGASMSGICKDKVILVAGVANEKSLAWGIARSVCREGGQLVLSCMEPLLDRVKALAPEVGDPPVFICDATDDGQIEALSDRIERNFGRLDGLAHCIAFAPREALQGEFQATNRESFKVALECSAHSLCALTAGMLPLMEERGGSAVTLSFDTSRAYPNYNVMGVAKAALEAEVRYLALNLGPKGIRLNALSAGPQNTLAARGISNFGALKQRGREMAPLGWNPDDTGPVGDAAAYLLSDLSRAVTGTVHYVDGGIHVVGA
jgi:enoyl-[acyl-carrier protein] reductase I